MRFIDFKDHYPTEESCKLAFKKEREQIGVICKRCEGEEHYWLTSKEMYQCKNNKCRFRTSIKSGTVMENSKMSFLQWFITIHLFTSAKMNLSILEIQKQVGHKYYEPIFDMTHKLRLVMGKRDSEYQLDDETELDEGYFSNSKKLEKNEFTGITEDLKRGKGSQKKSTVLVMHSFKKAIKTFKKNKFKTETIPRYLKMVVIDDTTSKTLIKEVKKNISEEAKLTTDNNCSYNELDTIVNQHTAHNVGKESAGKVLPWVHKAISNSKSILYAIHHGVSEKYMQNYLNEYCYKFNRKYFGEKLFNRLLMTCATYTWY